MPKLAANKAPVQMAQYSMTRCRRVATLAATARTELIVKGQQRESTRIEEETLEHITEIPNPARDTLKNIARVDRYRLSSHNDRQELTVGRLQLQYTDAGAQSREVKYSQQHREGSPTSMFHGS